MARYTFEKPQTPLQMTCLISQFNKTTSAAKKEALRDLFNQIACKHGFIKIMYRTWRWNGIDWLVRTDDHDCKQTEVKAKI